MTARELIALIRDLDAGLMNPDENYPGSYLDLMRWQQGGGGSTDSAAVTLVRQLAREKLGTFPLDEIGSSVLAEIDSSGREPA